MRQKWLKIIIGFISANVLVVLGFYTWVLSSSRHDDKRKIYYSKISENDISAVNKELPYFTRQRIVLGIPNNLTLAPQAKESEDRNELPPVPFKSDGDYVPFIRPSLKKKFQAYPEVTPTDSVVILTPIHNVAEFLKKRFLKLLQSINYPHRLISIAFGEDGSHDDTLDVAEKISAELRKSFARVDVYHFNLTGQVDGSWNAIHAQSSQLRRRRHLARARNALLEAGLKGQTWTLWIDSDISHFDPDIIQQLMSAGKDIVAPVCLYKGDNDRLRVYDKNTWRETPESLREQEGMGPKELLVEGYSDTKRLWLSDLRGEGRVVPIDGVGGCTLLVKSQCHVKGVKFPERVFQHHVETEGMAKLAKHMGYQVYGMPFVEVIHS